MAHERGVTIRAVDGTVLFRSSEAGSLAGAVREAALAGVPLRRADLRHADLSGLDLSDVHGADFSLADLSGSDLSRAKFQSGFFRGARLVSVKAQDAGFHGCDFRRATLGNSAFDSVDFRRSNMMDADLSSTIFFRCRLDEARLGSEERSGISRHCVFMACDYKDTAITDDLVGARDDRRLSTGLRWFQGVVVAVLAFEGTRRLQGLGLDLDSLVNSVSLTTVAIGLTAAVAVDKLTDGAKAKMMNIGLSVFSGTRLLSMPISAFLDRFVTKPAVALASLGSEPFRQAMELASESRKAKGQDHLFMRGVMGVGEVYVADPAHIQEAVDILGQRLSGLVPDQPVTVLRLPGDRASASSPLMLRIEKDGTVHALYADDDGRRMFVSWDRRGDPARIVLSGEDGFSPVVRVLSTPEQKAAVAGLCGKASEAIGRMSVSLMRSAGGAMAAAADVEYDRRTHYLVVRGEEALVKSLETGRIDNPRGPAVLARDGAKWFRDGREVPADHPDEVLTPD